ncbi:hypothetical protein IV454_22375 [Massilia antarctica]|uniref:Uncharacterized protein n=1 Tax=Massilia antarctica TaxID=2765360 RepID=A0AA49A719_9BURK|nr:hypothetical protein [Massilia antarctica]QPI48272.1 hypothetical protein IV454_22375 [Massilia antarctica]
MAPSRLSLFIAAPIVLVSALALGLGVALQADRLDDTTRAIEESRLRFTLDDLRERFEARMALGLPLKAMPDAAAALERELRRDPDIVFISVIDNAAAPVFRAGAGAADADPPALRRQAAARDWLLREPGFVTLGARLSRPGGVPAGTLLLRHATQRQAGAVAMVTRELTLATVCAVLLTTVCIVFGVDLLVRRMDGMLARMNAALGRLPCADGAAALVDDVNQTAASALHDLAAARDTLAPGAR